MADMTLGPVAGIVIVLYVIAELLKKTVLKSRPDLNAALPYVCAILGGVAAVAICLIDPTMIGIDNPLIAVVYGIGAGLTAPGANQLYKQYFKLMSVSHTTATEIKEEVANMTDEERKEYIKDQVTEVLEKVVDSIPQEKSTEVETNVKDPTTTENTSK